MKIWHRKRPDGTPGTHQAGTGGTLWWHEREQAARRTVTVAGGDGAILPLTPEEYKAAKSRGQFGVCAAASCGRALDASPWSVEAVPEVPAGQDDGINPARRRMREILASRAAFGATPALLGRLLESEHLEFTPATLRMWLRADEQLGILHQCDHGRWKTGALILFCSEQCAREWVAVQEAKAGTEL